MSTAAAPMLLTYKYRLNPEKRQHRALERILEQQRQLYNGALEERILAYDKGVSISEGAQSKSLTVIRADDPTFAGVQRRIQRETLRRLDRAYKSFFRRAKSGAGASSGFPKFKARERFDGFGFDAFLQVKLEGNGLRFAGMPGKLRFWLDRPLPRIADPETRELAPSVKNVWFKRRDEWNPKTKRACQVWYCGFQVERESATHRHGCGKGAVGVDWGTSVLAALSTGETIPNPRHGEALAAALARAQRSVARKKKGSKGARNARAYLQHVSRRIAERRKSHLDKLSKRLVTQFGFIAVEDLNVKGMMNTERPGETLPQFVKTRRNREALDAAPYKLRQMLAYKAELYGARLVAVDPKHTTQLCSMCGRLHFKELTDTEHVCTTPGPFQGRRMPRKLNAARVILRRGLQEISSPVDGSRGGPVPGGLNGGSAVVRNADTGPRRLGNTEGGQPPTGRRPRMGTPLSAHAGTPKKPPSGRLLSDTS